MKKIIFYISLIVLFSCTKSSNESDDDSTEEVVDDETLQYEFTYNSKSYIIVKEAKTWQDAASYAVDQGGYLAEIDNEDEQNAVFLELTTNAEITFSETANMFGYGAVWIGGNDLLVEGEWIWDGDGDLEGVQFWSGEVDGYSVNDLYNNWGVEPDNNGDQDALCIGLEETIINEEGKWTDLSADTELFFVIEFDDQ